MERGATFAEDIAPPVGVLADEIAHFDLAVPACRAQWPAANGPHMLFELRCDGPVRGPVAGIVNPGRNLVDHQRFP